MAFIDRIKCLHVPLYHKIIFFIIYYMDQRPDNLFGVSDTSCIAKKMPHATETTDRIINVLHKIY